MTAIAEAFPGAAETASPYRLAMRWTSPADGRRGLYEFTLENRSDQILERFTLAFCGPARIDLAAPPPDNAVLIRRFSNHTVVAMPSGLSLGPGLSWTFVIHGTQAPLRHYTDAAQTAYVTLADGSHRPVAVERCISSAFGPGAPRLDNDELGEPAALKLGLGLSPWPADVDVSGAREAGPLLIRGDGDLAAEAIAGFESVVARLFPDENLVGGGAGAVAVQLTFSADQLGEAYRIGFGETIAIRAGSSVGLLYGLVTLGQIVRAARLDPDHCRLPFAGHIADAPRFSWRGCHLDVARQFYSLDEIRDLLAVMVWHKLNRFHLHLTEDEAWRHEVSAYPELVEVGAFRGADLPIPPLLGSGIEPEGGTYSKAELRELVGFAAGLAIEVIPEIDVPGHCHAALTALPRLRDRGENSEYVSIQGFPNNCLNSAVPEVRAFAETVFDELMDIFPGKWIHVGADEVPDDAWTGSPAAQARLREIGGKDSHDLQADFLKSLHAHIRAAGRVTGAWEEGANGDGITPEGAYLVAWRNTKVGAELAARGYDVVMAPGQAYYLDMARSTDWWEPGASWAGVSSLQNSYEFDPLSGFPPEHQARMIGIQACIWSEPMRDRRVFRRLVFPRLGAIAETAWTADKDRDFARFKAVARYLPMLPQMTGEA